MVFSAKNSASLACFNTVMPKNYGGLVFKTWYIKSLSSKFETFFLGYFRGTYLSTGNCKNCGELNSVIQQETLQ